MNPNLHLCQIATITDPELQVAIDNSAKDFLAAFESIMPDLASQIAFSKMLIVKYQDSSNIAYAWKVTTITNQTYYAVSQAGKSLMDATLFMEKREVQADMLSEMAVQLEKSKEQLN